MLRVELTEKCNLSCEHCLIETPRKESLNLEDIEKLMPMFLDYKEKGFHRVMITGGEPTLVPDFPEIVEAFAQNNFHIEVFTNGIFAEKGILRNSDFELSGRDLSEKMQEKLETILQNPIGNNENINSAKKALRKKYALLNGMKRKAYYQADVKVFINTHLVATNFYNFFRKINHQGRLKKIVIGYDKFHLMEREERGYTQVAPLADVIRPFLSRKLRMALKWSSGEYPAFIGRAKNAHGFFLMRPWKSDRHTELEKAYKNNWSEVMNPEIPQKRKNYLSMIADIRPCFHNHITIKSDKGIHLCTLDVLPPFYDADWNKVQDISKIRRQFNYNGGPLGVARRYGIPEKTIYNTLMDKGPCGVCDLAMKVRNHVVN